MTQAATTNLKEAVKDGLCDVSSRNLRTDHKTKKKMSTIFFPKTEGNFSEPKNNSLEMQRNVCPNALTHTRTLLSRCSRIQVGDCNKAFLSQFP